MVQFAEGAWLGAAPWTLPWGGGGGGGMGHALLQLLLLFSGIVP